MGQRFYVAPVAPRLKPAVTWMPGTPPRRQGKPCAGRVAKLFVGNGHGFIRLADNREVYFHRADIAEGSSINDFAVGDAVTFELFEDAVSGARCLRVTPRSARS
jgi:cold shock CspA family protein